MANQIIIDIGAVANDGTGDPLRTAFNYVNNNFSNVWNTGLPDANISFSGNRILTVNTNGNLILAPNGIGKVVANVDIVPNANITHSLGALNRRWNTVYTQFIDVTGDVDFAGDLTINGNLIVEGDTIQIGNIVTDTKTIQLANTANTAVQANGSGITVGANDNIATMLYSSTSNTWVMSIGANITGNVTAPYFIGNGSLLTGISTYGNANVAAYLASGTNTSNIVTTNNVSANNINFTNNLFGKTGTFTGDVNGDNSIYAGHPNFTNLGSDVIAQFSGDIDAYIQFNFQNGNAGPQASGDYVITADNGNDSTHFLNLGITGSGWDGSQPNSLGNRLGPNDGYLYVQDGDMVIGTSNGNIETWKFGQDGTLTVAGDILPTGNNTQSLGSATNQWADLWVSNNTIYINSVPISLGAGNVLTVNGEALLSNDSNTTITTTGNITADYFFGTSLTGTSPSASVSLNAYSPDGNTVTIQAQGNSSNAIISTYANTTATANTWTFGIDGTTALPNYTLLTPINNDLIVTVQDDENDDWALYNRVTDTGTTLSETRLRRGDFRIDFPNTSKNFNFDDSGVLGLPGDIALNTQGGDISLYAIDDGDSGSAELKTISYAGGTLGSNVRVTQNAATISTNNAAYTWTFDNTGNLTVPGNISMDWLNIGNVGNITSLEADVKLQIVADAGNAAPYWTFNDDGNLFVPGNINGDNSAPLAIDGAGSGEGYISLPNASFGGEQVAIVNKFSLGNGIRLETNGGNLFFDNAGNLTLPGNTFSVNYANGTAVSLGGDYSDSNVVSLMSSFGSNTVSTTGNITAGNFVGAGSNVDIVAGSYDWTFVNDGNLVLPGNTFAVKYANGTAVSLGGNYGNANVADFLDSLGSNAIVTTGNITGGNIITANAASVILGNAVSSIKQNGSNATVNLSGSVTLSPDTAASANNGVVIGGNGYLLAPNGSRNAVLNYNGASGTMGIYSVNVYGNTATAIENGGANGVGNIGANASNRFNTVFARSGDFSGNVTAANFTGNINITGNVTGTSPNVTLVAGSYSYTFDNTGILTLPTGSSGNEGGEIAFTQAANSTLAGNTVVIDQYVDQIRFFESGGNTRGAYIDLTQAADGVGTLLNNRVSARVDAGTFVTMDNLKVTVTSSGNRGLSIAAVSGSFSADIGAWYGGSGAAGGDSVNNLSVTTTPSDSLFSWNFVAEANTAQYTIFDNTNNRVYRVTMMIGPAYLNNFISIERLL